MPLTGAEGTAATPGSTLCRSCGLCCRGTYHSVALLRAAEVEPARALGLEVLEADRSGASAFALPCPRLEGDLCGVYARRPSSCREYRCGVLRRLEAGEIGLERALEIVRGARERVAAVNRELDVPAQAPLPWRRIERELAPSPPGSAADARAGSAARARLGLRIATLRVYLGQHFRREADGRWLERSVA